MLKTPTFVGGSTTTHDDSVAASAAAMSSFGVATPGRVVALSAHVPSSIVERYVRNPAPLDPNAPDIQSTKAALLIVRLYSLVNSGEAAPRSHQASYLSIIEDIFQIIIEEGGDILQVLNGAEIVAVWNESDEELSTVIRRVAICAQKIRSHLQQKIACLGDNSNNSNSNNNSSTTNNLSNSLNSNSIQNNSFLNNNNNNHNNSNNSIGNINGLSNTTNSSLYVSNSNSQHQHQQSFINNSVPFGTSVSGALSTPQPISIPISSTSTSTSSFSQSFHPHHQHQQQSYQTSSSIPINGYNNSFSNHNPNIYVNNNNSSSNNSSSNIYHNNNNNSYNNNNSISNHNSGGNYNNLNLPSVTSFSNFNNISSSSSISSQQHHQQQQSNAGSPNINQSTTANNSGSGATSSTPCNDPLFNIYISCGEMFMGSVGGENNSWLELLGGDAFIGLNKIIRAYESRYGISSFPVKLSLGRLQPTKNTTSSLAVHQQRIKNLVHYNSSPQPLLSVSPAGIAVMANTAQHCHLNRVFGQIIFGSETYQHIRLYSQCEFIFQDNSISNNSNINNNSNLNESTSSTTTTTTTTPLYNNQIYLLRQMQELSKPVGIGLQMDKLPLRDLSPEHLIAIHKLLWCHLPIHVKVLASSLMSTNTNHPSMEQFRLTQDWSLETRNVTFLVLHFFNLFYKWDTINFFHPIIAKLQEILRKSDGTVTDIIQKSDGVFVVCAMGLPPFSSDNHSVAGVKNAMDIGRMMQTHNKHFIRDVNILVLTEKIVCGLVGNKTRSEYVVIGDKIHHATQWLSTVRSQTTLGTSNNSNTDNNNIDEYHPNSGRYSQQPVSEGGWVLCDDTTRKACDKAITFDTVTYDIQFSLSLLKFRTGLVDMSNYSMSGLKRSVDHNYIYNNQTTTTAAATATTTTTTASTNINGIRERDNMAQDNNQQDADDESVSVTFSLRSSVNSDLSLENNTPIGHHSHSFDNDKHHDSRVSFHCLPWTQQIATMITYRPLSIAHIPTTMDYQMAYYNNNNNNSNSNNNSNETCSIVGRKKEISSILNRYSLLTERLTSSFTLIEADFGLGKSSLVTEIYKQCAKDGAQVLCGSCSLLEKSKAYNVWTGVFSDLFFSEFSLGETRFAHAAGGKQQYQLLSWTRYKHVQSMPPEQIRQYIFQKFTDRRPELLPLLSLLNPVLRIDFPPNEITNQYMGSSAMLLEKTFELLAYFLRLTASRRRLVIILEDIHYMDQVSLSLLMKISFAIRPIMIIATSRPQKDKPKELNRIIKAFSPAPPVSKDSSPPPLIHTSEDEQNQHQQQTNQQPINVEQLQQQQHQQTDQQPINVEQLQQQQSSKSNLITPLSFEYYEMQLQPLPTSAIREIIRRQLGVRIVSNNIYQLIQFKCEGNPFVCIEMTKNLRERDYIVVHEDHCYIQPIHFTRGFPPISDVLESFYLSKVNHLTNTFSIILKVASVMGLYIFPYPLIHLLYPIGSKRPFLRDILQKLVESGLLVSTKRSQLSSEFLYFPPSAYLQTTFNKSLQQQSSNNNNHGSVPNLSPKINSSNSSNSLGYNNNRNSLKDFSTSMKITSIIGGFNQPPTPQHSSFKLPPPMIEDIADSDEDDDEYVASSSHSFRDSSGQQSQHRYSTFGQSSFRSLNSQMENYSSLNGTNSTAGRPSLNIGEEDWNQYYGFKSPLLQEAMYNSLLPAQRHSLHQKIAKWIEETYTADELTSYNELLADHWSKTDMTFQENLSKALQHTFASGEDAAGRFDYLDMIKYHSEYLNIFKTSKTGSIIKQDTSRRFIPSSPHAAEPIFSEFDDSLLWGPPLTIGMTNEERLKYVVSTRRIAEGYASLGYFEHAEQYFLHALSVVKEPPPKASSTLVVSVLTQVTKQNFFKFASKNKHQVYSDSYLSPTTALTFETACVYSSLTDYYFKGNNLALALYCAMHAVQGMENHQSLTVWMVSPELAVAYARLSLITSIYPFCGSVSPSLGKQSLKIIDDLIVGYILQGNKIAVSNLMTSIATLGLRDVYLGSWDRVEEMIRKCTDIFDRYPNSYIKDRDLILFVFVSYRLIKGELNTVHAIIDECLAHNLASMTWMATLTFYHMKALTLTLQGRYMDAYQVIIEAETSRPTTEGIEMILRHSVTSSIYFSRGEIIKALDDIASITPLIGTRPGSCGIRIIFAYSLICRCLLNIVEKDRLKSTVTVPIKTSIIIHDPSSSSSLNSTKDNNNQSSSSGQSSSSNNNKDFVAFESLSFQSTNSLPKMYTLKESKRKDSIPSQQPINYNQDLLQTNNNINSNNNSPTNNNEVNNNNNNNGVGGNVGSNQSSSGSSNGNSPDSPLLQINGIQIYVDDNYNGGHRKNSLTGAFQQQQQQFELDTSEIEMWIKRIINEIKLMEKITPFSSTSFNRLSGVFTIVFPNGSGFKQRGLALLYKSAKEAKIQGLPLEEALSWHEISKYEDKSSIKQKFAWKNAQDLYQRMGIDPSVI
ncbi:hypothetical protein PPL_11288 [Heterostelium album PN500]|uniref:Orc1-like AAA ATPase domain-containing protein n=1 Tax=Heterostelium pallidum (strain ATCC 26659 / Pp 5 / PN500) TaxID=670386 RepID=D3BU28_HETP5|nr:hypothetical protein PPL_11288 [Heterostelium album PN500]EFA75214.1 hypothetical protein PPL_11288 [Heterostelium album PN500]|eukprot:XP_020427348.1 hypothetical protein PPL_11288 [Heterostelium album PN500]